MAYALYCVIPFSKLNNSNRTIKDAAEVIGRSPAALKMKICNLAALDPDFLATGRVGLWGGISKLDREIYEEFSKDWEGLSTKAESRSTMETRTGRRATLRSQISKRGSSSESRSFRRMKVDAVSRGRAYRKW
mgnify:CR=1 FL=1